MPSISRACRAVVMLGPSGAGKSNLFSRFIHDKFNPDSEVTIGVDFASKVMETFDGVKVKTQLWDTGTCCPLHTLFTSVVYGGNIAVCDAAGQEKYRAMTSA